MDAVTGDAPGHALNPQQQAAVDAPDGPLLIFAGAGSGKTRVLTQRIARIIRQGVPPSSVCAVTFTNKAAREMRERLEQLVGSGVAGMWLGTFHSIGVRMLRQSGELIGIDPSFSIYDEADRLAAVRSVMNDVRVDTKRFPAAVLVHAISAAKNELLDARQYSDIAHDYFENEVARVFFGYESELGRANALDFDDLVARTVLLLETQESARTYYQQRFTHLFVDEYQDTNRAQYRMVRAMAAGHGNLTVVGDDDQSIYGWRGADIRNILEFERDYPSARKITLEQNYRSTQTILDAAHHVIRHNSDRAEKRLWTDAGEGSRIVVLSAYDEQDEAGQVCTRIEELVGEGARLADCAVLYRTNAQSRAFEDTFIRRGVPYRLVGGVRFYQRKEVRDILAYLRLLINPRDTASFERVVNVPRRKIGDKSLSILGQEAARHGLAPFEALLKGIDVPDLSRSARTALTGFSQLMQGLGERARTEPASRVVAEVIQASGYRAMLLDGTPEGEDRVANLDELIGFASEYSDEQPPEGLMHFLEQVALVSDVDGYDETGSGVTLITLHQVKGLEFSNVFLTGMEERLLPHARAMEDGDGGIEEERRLAYVGITRARTRLYLSHAARRHLYGTQQIAEPSRFLKDIPQELLVTSSRRSSYGYGAIYPSTSTGPGSMPGREPPPSRRVPAAQQFWEGMRAGHPKFGEGTVLRSTMTRTGEEVVINFDSAGVKIFAVEDAALSVLPGAPPLPG